MYLKSLTIKGFKSFARKTVLEFQPGVTIIVGPNGSGKSNIADAVMWALGEQSPTTLRGNRMEDIIFSGSNSLKPVNLAEVALTLDNSGNVFPLEFSEVTVSRNVVRGGDSEYRLNSSSCRLLDIQELLSDAGVGRTLNSVISQGQLDEVLACRPEERREYIEEAGGLLKYRRRREKALRRLSSLDEELLRTNDIMREVRRQLRPLQRQAGRLEQYRSLTRELADSQMRLDVARLRVMQREWDSHQEAQEARTRALEALDAELASKAREAARLEDAQSDWREREARLRENLYRLVSLHEALKATLGGWSDRRRGAHAGVDEGELAELKSRNRAAEARRSELEAELASLRERESAAARSVSELNVRLTAATRRAAAMEARLEVIREADEGAAEMQARILGERLEELERLKAEREALRRDAERLGEAVERARREVAGLQEEFRSAAARRSAALEKLRELDRERAGLAATLDLLNRLDTRGWDELNTVAALAAFDPTDGGLGGTLAQSARIESAWERAILDYLGPWAFGLIARDGDAIRAAIEHLKERGLGQSRFFKHSGGAGPATGPPREIDGARPAADAVGVPGWFSGAVDALLSDVYLVDDLDTAFSLADRYPALVFLTPECDAVSGGTLVKGGSPEVSEVHLQLTRGRREKMERRLADCESVATSLELELATLEAEADAAADKLHAARAEADEAVTAWAEGAARLSSCEGRLRSVEQDVERMRGKADGNGEKQSRPAGVEAGLEEALAAVKDIEAELNRAERERVEAGRGVSDAAARLAALSGELERDLDRERELEAGLSERRREDASAGAKAAAERLAALHAALVARASALREEVRAEIERGAAAAEQEARTLRSLREEVAGMQDSHEELRDTLHGEDLSRAELKIRVEQLVARIVDGYSVPLEFALKQYTDEEPDPELERKVERLSAELEHIGPVNPEAITEMESLEQRFEFLKEQTEDIERSKKQLRRVVQQVDREIEEKFAQTLEAVNEHFKEIFSMLFPKGTAELRLTQPDDMLNSGVEILAQPEGRKLRRISLLSGGETSLTALAFFFALFKVRPSPFYFLDEVEAALDDVNLHRFLELVKQFKGESQLILITHQKRSMEIGDILYGVTMQEDGVSRVVSQKVAS